MLLNISKIPAHGCLISALPLTPLIILRSWIVYLYSVWCAIHGSALSWFKSYLSDRLFRVKCSHDLPESRESCCGLPEVKAQYFDTLYHSSQFTHFVTVTQSPLVRCLSPCSLLVLLKTSLAYKALSVLLLPG